MVISSFNDKKAPNGLYLSGAWNNFLKEAATLRPRFDTFEAKSLTL